MKHDPILRASQVGQYAYCAKAWWLGSVQGVPSTNVAHLVAGTAAHEQHGRLVAWGDWLARAAWICLVLGIAALGIGLLAAW